MFFTSTHRFTTTIAYDELVGRITGKHLKIHNMDFEVFYYEGSLKIIPHAEDVEQIITLPITHVDFQKNGSDTKVAIISKMRKLDAGGPYMLLSFCVFMILFAIFLFCSSREILLSSTILAVGIFVLIVFLVRMEMGYFDYCRKIRHYIKGQLS